MSPPAAEALVRQLEALRTELADRAFALDRAGRADAADLASETARRLGDLCAETRVAAPPPRLPVALTPCASV